MCLALSFLVWNNEYSSPFPIAPSNSLLYLVVHVELSYPLSYTATNNDLCLIGGHYYTLSVPQTLQSKSRRNDECTDETRTSHFLNLVSNLCSFLGLIFVGFYENPCSFSLYIVSCLSFCRSKSSSTRSL